MEADPEQRQWCGLCAALCTRKRTGEGPLGPGDMEMVDVTLKAGFLVTASAAQGYLWLLVPLCLPVHCREQRG